jgi:hypothetical protein
MPNPSIRFVPISMYKPRNLSSKDEIQLFTLIASNLCELSLALSKVFSPTLCPHAVSGDELVFSRV